MAIEIQPRELRSVGFRREREATWRAPLRALRPDIAYRGLDASEYVVSRYGRSRNIGLAENALRALLNKALQHTGLDYHRWVALKLVADGQWPIAVTTLIGQLKDFLKMDEASALAAIAIRQIFMNAPAPLDVTIGRKIAACGKAARSVWRR